MSDKHGSSPYIQSDGSDPAEAEFYDFAPAPCVCLGCCIPEYQKTRTYLRAYDNRWEMNKPIAPFCKCTCMEVCVVDQIYIGFYDRIPTRIGMVCCCIPCTICGPPVLFVEKPFCCCFDLSECYGQQIKYAPCSCCGCRAWLCCGAPCYKYTATEFVGGIKNGDQFLAKWSNNLEKYWKKHSLQPTEMAVFASLADGILDMSRENKITGAPRQAEMS